MGLFTPAWLGDDKEKSRKAIAELDAKTVYGDGKHRKQWLDVALKCRFDDQRVKAIKHILRQDCNAEENAALATSVIAPNGSFDDVVQALLDDVSCDVLLGFFDLFPDEYKAIAYGKAIDHFSNKWEPSSDNELDQYSHLMSRMVKMFPQKEWPSQVQALLEKDKYHFPYGIRERANSGNQCPAGYKTHNYVYADSSVYQDDNGNFVKRITKRCSYCGDTYTHEEYD